MNNESLKTKIAQWEQGIEFEDGSQFLNIITSPDKLLGVANKLRFEEDMLFDFMFSLTCVDFSEYFMMVYHLRSIKHTHEIVLKVKIENREKPEVDTLCSIWRTAEYHEREVFDLFGVVFTNHPDLRRILLTDEWEGYPLRKDYVDTVNMISL